MNQALQLALLIHMHLPPGLDRAEFEQRWRDCYQPLIGALHHSPQVKLGLVLGGELVQDFQEHHPEGIEWIRGLVERGQVELLGTALHEPVLSAIPEWDGVGQLKAHAALLKRIYGVRPTGAWLPNGVWDPVLPRIYCKAGFEWTTVDDTFLEQQGEPARGVCGVYRTEREGASVSLLPMDTRARGMSARVPVRKVLGHLRKRQSAGHGLVTLGLEADVFGLLQDPDRSQAWFATLIASMAQAAPALETVLPSKAIADWEEQRRIYLPTMSPATVLVPWERYLARYDEANRLHKRMLWVSRTIRKLDKRIAADRYAEDCPDPARLVQAQRYLYRAQAAHVYWHGEHAGVYDAGSRFKAWRDVIRAEREALEALGTRSRMSIDISDISCDGVDEVVLRTPTVTAILDPARSGGLTEFCVYDAGRNLVDTMTRLEEPYHAELRKDFSQDLPTEEAPKPELLPDDEPTLGFKREELAAAIQKPLLKRVGWDPDHRVCFSERLLAPDVTLDDLRRGSYTEVGRGFHHRRWTVVTAERHGDDALRANLTADGVIHDPAGERKARLHKRYTLLREPRLEVRLDLINRSHTALRTRLAWELNLSVDSDSSDDILVVGSQRMVLDEQADLGDSDTLAIEGDGLKVEIMLERAARIWTYPVQTVHQHRGEQVVAVQGICIILGWPVELWGQEKARFKATMSVIT